MATQQQSILTKLEQKPLTRNAISIAANINRKLIYKKLLPLIEQGFIKPDYEDQVLASLEQTGLTRTNTNDLIQYKTDDQFMSYYIQMSNDTNLTETIIDIFNKSDNSILQDIIQKSPVPLHLSITGLGKERLHQTKKDG